MYGLRPPAETKKDSPLKDWWESTNTYTKLAWVSVAVFGTAIFQLLYF